MTISFDYGMDTAPGTALNQVTSAHPNPMFDYLTGFVPRKLKDLFRWAEYLSVQSAHIFATVRKFAEYPITELKYENASDGEKALRKDLYGKYLKLLGFLSEVTFNKYVYGNVFISIYEPFKRFLPCKHCSERYDIQFVTYTFNLKNLKFTFECPSCHSQTTTDPEDEKIEDIKRLRLVIWDPKLIDIEHNRVTKESVYYYTIPRSDIAKVEQGSRIMIDHMPLELLTAMKQGTTFKFAPGALYHMKTAGPVGVESQWGLPPIIAAIKLFLFTSVLRRANEAIAMDHITPFRVMFPQGASGQGDPISTINLATWRSQLQENYRRFRRDPLHIMIAPIPLGYQSIGGEGRTLLTIAEIQEAEKNIILSMGVPIEFVTGGLGQNNGEATLRQIQNQLQNHIDDLNGLCQWIEDETSRFFNRRPVVVKLAPFKLLDDTLKQQALLQLWMSKKVSDTTMSQSFGIDSSVERKQMREDAIADMRMQMETEAEIQKLQSSLAANAAASAQASGKVDYNNQQAALASADQVVEQMLSLDPGSRRSQMDALATEDQVMYALVKLRIEQVQQNQTQQMKAQARSQ
jgi:hypothetical protein